MGAKLESFITKDGVMVRDEDLVYHKGDLYYVKYISHDYVNMTKLKDGKWLSLVPHHEILSHAGGPVKVETKTIVTKSFVPGVYGNVLIDPQSNIEVMKMSKKKEVEDAIRTLQGLLVVFE